MGTLFKKKGSKQWQMGVMVGGRQICTSANTMNKRTTKSLLARWETEVFERRFHLPQSTPPYFEDWADKMLTKMAHPNTRKRRSARSRVFTSSLTTSNVLTSVQTTHVYSPPTHILPPHIFQELRRNHLCGQARLHPRRAGICASSEFE
jgi:hypothetical protein